MILLILVILAIAAGLFAYPSKYWSWFPSRPYSLGLDIAGGTSLTYRANLEDTEALDRADAMEGLRDVVERRVNLFGVREPRVEIARSAGEWRLIVELAGIKNINEAIAVIGETPFLEFRRECAENEKEGLSDEEKEFCFVPTGLTGQYLSRADIEFDPTTREPMVALRFNDEGAKLFGQITSENVGKFVAIFLDGAPISVPVVRDAITTGRAQITGRFTLEEAKKLTRRLNEGALPVKIELISQRTVGATLGEESFSRSIKAGLLGFLLVAIFMIACYRVSGVFAVAALFMYAAFVLSIFKLIPVTLTLSGIAGVILSVGMAVDANILIFERTREELRRGQGLKAAVRDGFSRAWPSIRDSNVTTIITAIVLYTFATSVIKGFALALLIGVLVSMFSAIFITRSILASFATDKEGSIKWLFGVKGFVQR